MNKYTIIYKVNLDREVYIEDLLDKKKRWMEVGRGKALKDVRFFSARTVAPTRNAQCLFRSYYMAFF